MKGLILKPQWVIKQKEQTELRFTLNVVQHYKSRLKVYLAFLIKFSEATPLVSRQAHVLVPKFKFLQKLLTFK